jgi:hypothetical protein
MHSNIDFLHLRVMFLGYVMELAYNKPGSFDITYNFILFNSHFLHMRLIVEIGNM